MELGGINQESKVAMPISVSYGAIHESSSKFKMQQLGGGNGALQQQGPSTEPGSKMTETAAPAGGLPLGLAAAKKAVRYRECLKNHAASIGGHAVDGCGEFMPSGDEGTLEALKCAACGCHRNFHRREVDGEAGPASSCGYCLVSPRGGGFKKRFAPTLAALPPPPHAAPLALPPASPAGRVGPPPMIGGGGSTSGPLSPSDGDEPPMDHHHSHHHHAHLQQQHHHHHPPFGMMMDGPPGSMPYHHHYQHLAAAAAAAAAGMAPSSSSVKKRFRTKFTAEQKDKMCAFAEKLGWRIQKHDEAAVQQFCSDVGVKRHVLKVWMHNNKNTVGKKMSSASDIGVGYLDNGEASPTTSSGING